MQDSCRREQEGEDGNKRSEVEDMGITYWFFWAACGLGSVDRASIGLA